MAGKRKNLNIDRILADREKGMTIEELATRYRVCHSTIRERLREIGKYKSDKAGKGAQKKPEAPHNNWDKPPKLTKEDVEFLIKYDLKEFIK